MFESISMSRELMLFNAAIRLLANKDITPDRAVKLAVEVEGKVWDVCDTDDKDVDGEAAETMKRQYPLNI